jgi:hypothetical protein
MQKHALLMGLGDHANAALGREIGGVLGIDMSYSSPSWPAAWPPAPRSTGATCSA